MAQRLADGTNIGGYGGYAMIQGQEPQGGVRGEDEDQGRSCSQLCNTPLIAKLVATCCYVLLRVATRCYVFMMIHDDFPNLLSPIKNQATRLCLLHGNLQLRNDCFTLFYIVLLGPLIPRFLCLDALGRLEPRTTSHRKCWRVVMCSTQRTC